MDGQEKKDAFVQWRLLPAYLILCAAKRNRCQKPVKAFWESLNDEQ